MKKYAALLCLLSLTGCSAYKIAYLKDPNDPTTVAELPGIPFYQKTTVYHQETVEDRIWLTVTAALQIQKKPDGDWQTLSTATKAYQPASLTGFENYTTAAASNTDPIKELNYLAGIHHLTELSTDQLKILRDPKTPPSDAILGNISRLAGNSVTANVKADTSRTYYYNAQIPPFGKADTSFKLGEDGTLSEGSSNVDNTALTALLPFGDLAKKVFGLEAPADATDGQDDGAALLSLDDDGTPDKSADQPPPPTYRILFAAQETGIRITYKRILPTPYATDPFYFESGVEFSVVPLPAKAAETPKSDDKSNQVSLNATLTLPKPAAE